MVSHRLRRAARVSCRHPRDPADRAGRAATARPQVKEPIAAVAGRYDLDRGALEAAARYVLAAPDRVVLDVLAPAA
jgi:hypothetical protein